MKPIGLTRLTADRLKLLLGRQPGAEGERAHGPQGRRQALVLCTSSTPATGSAGTDGGLVLAPQCYPGVILDPASGAKMPDELDELGPVWLTVLGEAGQPEAPEAQTVYLCTLAGEVSIGGDRRPRAFGTPTHCCAVRFDLRTNGVVGGYPLPPGPVDDGGDFETFGVTIAASGAVTGATAFTTDRLVAYSPGDYGTVHDCWVSGQLTCSVVGGSTLLDNATQVFGVLPTPYPISPLLSGELAVFARLVVDFGPLVGQPTYQVTPLSGWYRVFQTQVNKHQASDFSGVGYTPWYGDGPVAPFGLDADGQGYLSGVAPFAFLARLPAGVRLRWEVRLAAKLAWVATPPPGTVQALNVVVYNGAADHSDNYVIRAARSAIRVDDVCCGAGPYLAPAGSPVSTTLPPPTPPPCAFTLAPSGSPAPGKYPTGTSVTFAANPAGDVGTSWSWDFGDGGTAATQNPTHVFNTAGTFTVTATSRAADGCAATATYGPYVIYANTVKAVSADHTFAASETTLLVDASGGARTINLPDAATRPDEVLIAKKVDSSGNAVLLTPTGGQTLDGSVIAKSIGSQWGVLRAQSDGSNWYTV